MKSAHETILVFYKKLTTYNVIKTEGKAYVNAKKEVHQSVYGSVGAWTTAHIIWNVVFQAQLWYLKVQERTRTLSI